MARKRVRTWRPVAALTVVIAIAIAGCSGSTALRSGGTHKAGIQNWGSFAGCSKFAGLNPTSVFPGAKSSKVSSDDPTSSDCTWTFQGVPNLITEQNAYPPEILIDQVDTTVDSAGAAVSADLAAGESPYQDVCDNAIKRPRNDWSMGYYCIDEGLQGDSPPLPIISNAAVVAPYGQGVDNSHFIECLFSSDEGVNLGTSRAAVTKYLDDHIYKSLIAFCGKARAASTSNTGLAAGSSSGSEVHSSPTSTTNTTPAVGAGSTSGDVTPDPARTANDILRPVTAQGTPAAGWPVDDHRSDGPPLDCSGSTPSTGVVSGKVYSCGDHSFAGAACWVAKAPNAMLCLIDPREHKLDEYAAAALPDAAPTRVGKPALARIDVADGARCVPNTEGTYELPPAHHDWSALYVCGTEASNFVWNTGRGGKDDGGIDKSTTLWTAVVGPPAGPFRTVAVTTVYFIGTQGS